MEAKAKVPVLALIGFNVLQGILILAGAFPPLSSGSMENQAAMVLKIALIVWIGVALSGEEIKKVLLYGAGAASASSIVFVLFSVIGKIIGAPVLGMGFETDFQLVLFYLIMVVANAVMGGIAAAVGAFAAKLLKKG